MLFTLTALVKNLKNCMILALQQIRSAGARLGLPLRATKTHAQSVVNDIFFKRT